MRRISVWLVCTWVTAWLGHAERPGSIGFGSVTFNDVTVHYESVLEPPLKDSAVFLLGSGVKAEGNGMHRYLVDGKNHSYFGYDLVVAPGGGHGHYLVSFEPLNVSEKDLQVFGSDVPLHPAPSPKYPPPQIVQDGDTIAIDLLLSPDGRQKLVDYIRIGAAVKTGRIRLQAPLKAIHQAARDFTLDDGSPNFQVLNPPKLLINGQEYHDPIEWQTEAGSTLELCIPGRGFYILSLTPSENHGLQRAGTVRDDAIQFQVDGDRFELQTSGPISGRGKAWNLYVLHQPQREVKAPLLRVGRLETLIY